MVVSRFVRVVLSPVADNGRAVELRALEAAN
jgi:hypothetical protein